MRKLIDVRCPGCGTTKLDVWAGDGVDQPVCGCGTPMERVWLSAPAVTPQGTQPERRNHMPAPRNRVDTRAIAAETMQEINAKMLRYADPVVAEQHVKREIDAASGADKPLPTPAPFTFSQMEAAS